MNPPFRRIHALVPRRAHDYGGKARALAALARAGFPVPIAFAIPGQAGEEFIAASVSPEDRLPALLALDHVPDERVHAIAEKIRRAPLPREFERALDDAFRKLTNDGADAVAVRSSSTIEDQDEASAAGLHSTFLHVLSRQALFEAVRACWSSLYSPRVLAYLRTTGRGAAVRMGVVVQAMVRADVAGVAFTLNPLTGDDTEVVVNAAYGLGSGVVDGLVTPDTFRIDKASLTLRDRVIGEKASRVVFADVDGTRTEPVPNDDRERPCLRDLELETLVHVATRLERHFGQPQDIEFAFSKGELHVLQARTITTHARKSRRTKPTSRDRSRFVWSNVNVGEALPGPATPLTWSVLSGFSDLGFRRAFGALGCRVPKDAELVGDFRGRIYLNMSEFMRILSQVPGMDARVLGALGGGDFVPLLEAGRASGDAPNAARFLARLPVTASRLLAESVTVDRRVADFQREFAEERRRLLSIDLRVLSPLALDRTLTDVERLLDRVGAVMLTAYGSLLASAVMLVGLLHVVAGEEAAPLQRDLLTGLSDLESAAPAIALSRLADVARRDAAAREYIGSAEPSQLSLERFPEGPTRRALADFLARYGHRGALEAEIAAPRWKEDPSLLFSTLRLHLATENGTAVRKQRDDRLGEIRLRAHRRVDETVPFGLRKLVRSLSHRVQRLLGLREMLRGYVIEVLGMVRRVALEVSRRIEVREPEAGSDAAFFLAVDEIHALLAGRMPHVTLRVQQRRAQHARDVALPDPPDTFVGYPPAGDEDQPADDVLSGLPASSGVAEGRVRVLMRPEEASTFRAGEVLVVPAADIGWSPLFLAASAVVTDLGGPLSHAAIVLRELGVPAVVNVKHGTRWLRTGDRVRVRADEGKVVRLGDT